MTYFPGNLDKFIDASGDCWNWTGGTDPDGYGIGRVNNKSVRVHRTVYKHLVGPIDDNLVLDHLCQNRRCCNPDHLEPVTNRENILRGNGLVGTSHRYNRCQRGHLFTPENTMLNNHASDGHMYRLCRTCHNAKSRRNRKNMSELTPEKVEARRKQNRRYYEERKARQASA